MDELNQSVDGLNQSTDKVNENLEDVHSDTSRLSDDTEKMRKGVEEAKVETTALNQKVGVLNESVDTLNNSVASVDDNSQTLNKNTEAMGKAVDKVVENTDGLTTSVAAVASNTHAIEKNTSGIENYLDVLYRDQRQATALAQRQQALSALRSAKSLKAGVVHASAYYLSFEYQLLKDIPRDDVDRSKIVSAGIQEFLLTISSLAQEINYAVDPSQDDQAVLALMALSLSADATNYNQSTEGDKALNMADLIATGLLQAKKEMAKGSESLVELDQNSQVYAVLSLQKEAEYFLNFRYNALIAAAVARLSGVEGIQES